MTTTFTIHYGKDDDATFEVANGYVQRCVSSIAADNLPDARWACEVLNKYGHLVQHEADRIV